MRIVGYSSHLSQKLSAKHAHELIANDKDNIALTQNALAFCLTVQLTTTVSAHFYSLCSNSLLEVI